MRHKPTTYIVTGGPGTARFSDYTDATRYAALLSGWYPHLLISIEGKRERGLIGQFRNGEPTPEFDMHWCAFEGKRP